MTRSARIEQRRAAHYQEPAPSADDPDGGIDFARLKIEPRYLPALDGTQPYHRAPECGRAAPISERRVAELVAEALEPPPDGEDEDALSAALATPEGRRVLQDDPCAPGGDPFWTELFAGAPRLDGAW